MVCMNVALIGWNRAEILPRSLVTETVNSIDAIVHQIGHDAVSQLQQALERAYLTITTLARGP